MPSKYDRLRDYLRSQPTDAWEATFAEVEGVLCFALPPSARIHQAWWANQDSGAQAGAWRDAGWRVDKVDLERGRVRFARHSARPGSRRARVAPAPSPEPGSPEEMRTAVAWSVRAWGAVVLDATGLPVFPVLPTAPGVYELTVGAAVYVGEAEDLRRRFRGYRTPGEGQPTNLRVQRAVREAVSAGMAVRLRAATEATVNGATADLSLKAERVLVEQAWLAAHLRRGVEVLNL